MSENSTHQDDATIPQRVTPLSARRPGMPSGTSRSPLGDTKDTRHTRSWDIPDVPPVVPRGWAAIDGDKHQHTGVTKIMALSAIIPLMLLATVWALHRTVGLPGFGTTAGIDPDTLGAGDGTLAVVSAEPLRPAVAEYRYQVAVSVENGLGHQFEDAPADIVDVLNDDRSWRADTDTAYLPTASLDSATVRFALVGDDYYDANCPVQTHLAAVCYVDGAVLIRAYTWAGGASTYAGNLDGLHAYLVNHGMGLALGKQVQPCVAPGSLAPVMMQQTSDLKGCRHNPWPTND